MLILEIKANFSSSILHTWFFLYKLHTFFLEVDFIFSFGTMKTSDGMNNIFCFLNRYHSFFYNGNFRLITSLHKIYLNKKKKLTYLHSKLISQSIRKNNSLT